MAVICILWFFFPLPCNLVTCNVFLCVPLNPLFKIWNIPSLFVRYASYECVSQEWDVQGLSVQRKIVMQGGTQRPNSWTSLGQKSPLLRSPPPAKVVWNWFVMYSKHCIRKPQVWGTLKIICPETSTKLYVHEFGFWSLKREGIYPGIPCIPEAGGSMDTYNLRAPVISSPNVPALYRIIVILKVEKLKGSGRKQ